ncbi:hypothetical protein SFC42_23190, partial [Priestia filamentosa]|uniref:hypothetical protein n=1 Tax=Priestia filamentosa TaxID=1402861 RepID=UPI0039831684
AQTLCNSRSLSFYDFLEDLLWCDKKSLSYSVANATHLDAKMISIRNGILGNESVGCMRKCGNRGQMHGPEYC